MKVFGLDPGVSQANATGVALAENGRIIRAGVIRRASADNGINGQYELAWNAVAWLGGPDACDTFVTELPQAYPGSRVDPNTALIPLWGIASMVAGMLGKNVRRVCYTPRSWKGTIDGDVFAKWIVQRLDVKEAAAVNAVMPAGLRHNAIDAVGLILKQLGRMERQRVVHIE